MQRNIFEGSDFLLFDIDQNPIAYCKNSAIKINRALADITTKDSDGWLDFLNGIKSWSLDFEGLVTYDDASFTTSYFLSKFKNSEPFFIQFGILQDDFTHTFWGEVAIESIEIDSDNGEIVSYSGGLKGIGKLTFTNQGTPEQSGYIKTETDPYFRSSSAHSITDTNIGNWNNAYEKTLSEVLFNTTENTTTLNIKLRDGSLYSTSFNHLGGSSGTVLTGLTFNPSTGNLSVNNLTTNLDGRYQLLGSYVSQQYLIDNHYSKTQSDTRFATFGYVDNQISSLINSAPSTLDTLQELANALGNDENFSTTITSLIGTKANASDVYSKIDSHSVFQPLENQRLSTSNNVVFNQITANSKLNIPSTSANKYSIFIDENGIGGSGSTIPSITFLNDLNDVSIASPVNGNVLMFNGSEWINSTITSGTFNYNDLINKPDLSIYALANGANASGTWGINITGSADYLQGYQSSVSPDGNTIVRRDGNGYILGTYFNMSAPTTDATDFSDFVTIGGDGYLRRNSPSAVQSKLGLGSFAYKSTVYGNEITTSRNDSPWDVGISKMLRWKNYGDGHVIFDASQGTSPEGTPVDGINSQQAWSNTYPTLMGWNGNNTYGVRVDSARVSDSTTIWGGQSANFAVEKTNLTSIGAFGVGNGMEYALAPAVREFIGLPSSGAYDLQWVTGNGASTPTNMTITNAYPWLRLTPTHWEGGETYIQSGIDASGTVNGDYLSFQNPTGKGFLFKQGGATRLSIGTNGDIDITGSAVVNGKIYAIGSGDSAASWANAGIEVRGSTNPAIAFHIPGVNAASLYMTSDARINWVGGGGLYVGSGIGSDGPVTATRISAGYDSNVAGSVNTNNYFRLSGGGGITWDSYGTSITSTDSANFHIQSNHTAGTFVLRTTNGISGFMHWNNSNEIGFLKPDTTWSFRVNDAGWVNATSFVTNGDWFRSNGAQGWYNNTYQGGIYMEDSTWVRVYGGKGFLVQNTIQADRFRATAHEGYQVADFGIGLTGNYDSYRYQAVFSMGAAYKMAQNGTSLANHYGIAWTHQNIGDQSIQGLEHQALFTMAGVTQTAIGKGIWTRGGITAVGHIDAQAELYVQNYVRSKQAGYGLYNEVTGAHFYSLQSSGYVHKSASNAYTQLEMKFANDTASGYLYGASDGFGLLNNQGGWSVRVNQGSGYGGLLNGSWNVNGDLTASAKVEAPTLKATNSLQVPAKNASGANTGNHFSIWVEV